MPIKLGHPVLSATGRLGEFYLAADGTVLRAHPHPRPPGLEKNHCPCKAWKHADWLYANGKVDATAWRKALKRPNMSPYDLWMRECMACFSKGLYAPDHPSISGGWSRDKITPGHTYQPSAECIKPYLASWTMSAYPAQPDTTEYEFELHAADPRPVRTGIAWTHVLVTSYPKPMAPYYDATAEGDTHNGVVYVPSDLTPLTWITITAADGTQNLWYAVGDQQPHLSACMSIAYGDYQRKGWWQ